MTITVTELPVPPKDPRFPSMNKAAQCWNKYNEWIFCLNENKGDETKCYLPRMFARSLCPIDWIERWDAERDEGTFSGLQNEF